MRPLTFVDVCAGAGGLSQGFLDAGFVATLLNDADKVCCDTLRLNHAGADIFHGRMEDIDLNKYKGVDVLVGGVPCQPFSSSGKREGMKDERGGLILHFGAMVDVLEPRVFLIENVKGLVTHDGGRTLDFIMRELDKYGKYNIVHRVLNANDYGVPQCRERLIIVGVHKSIQASFSYPIEHQYKPVLKDVLVGCPESPGMLYNEEKFNIMVRVPEGGCWIDVPEHIHRPYMGSTYYAGGGKRGTLKRLSMEKPCPTLLTCPSLRQTERCHPWYTRPLQTLEYARIQTFPDAYQFAGTTGQIYRQIGNAVPINMARALAAEVKAVLV